MAHSRNVRLVRLDGRTAVRIGDAELPERASWRYGATLRRRRKRFASPITQMGAALYGAANYLGECIGLADHSVRVKLDQDGRTDLVRWKQFGWAAWRGRRACPNCGSVLRALLYINSWGLRPIATEEGVAVGVPCPRCDFWTPDKVYRLDGEEAETTLRRVLAYQHVRGAAEPLIHGAAEQIQRAGSVADYCRTVGLDGGSLWKMEPVRRVALEIAVNELLEHRRWSMGVKALVAKWRTEEELAHIQDTELI